LNIQRQLHEQNKTIPDVKPCVTRIKKYLIPVIGLSFMPIVSIVQKMAQLKS
jgi:hypothetical protein